MFMLYAKLIKANLVYEFTIMKDKLRALTKKINVDENNNIE